VGDVEGSMGRGLGVESELPYKLVPLRSLRQATADGGGQPAGGEGGA